MKKILSIIIPHKDIPDLLSKCLKTIPNREDIEIIVVDDNSSKETKEKLVQLYMDNVRVIYTSENKGAGYARNVGIREASGKWLLFADADDYFSCDAFNFFEEYMTSSYDIIHFNQEGRYINSGEYANRCEMFSSIIKDYLGEASLQNTDRIKYCMHTPYVKMIRHSLVEEFNVRFDECIGSNDVTFSTLIGYHANKIKVDGRIAYYVSVRKGSLTKVRNKDNAFSRYCVWIKYNKFVISIKKPELQVLLLSRIFQALLYFGFIEFMKYIAFAKKEHVSVYVKFGRIFISGYHYLLSFIVKDEFLVKNRHNEK